MLNNFNIIGIIYIYLFDVSIGLLHLLQKLKNLTVISTCQMVCSVLEHCTIADIMSSYRNQKILQIKDHKHVLQNDALTIHPKNSADKSFVRFFRK